LSVNLDMCSPTVCDSRRRRSATDAYEGSADQSDWVSLRYSCRPADAYNPVDNKGLTIDRPSSMTATLGSHCSLEKDFVS
jgi:hypothetical protein